ncbi:molecular chaperone Tir [Corallococcus sp. AB049A]|uniref:Molecular chaperone Tir n=1 Tax=Corallococcus interemptor TaxID=2316720 RepID=A0A3A8QZ59_9BACT|nr:MULTISPECIES: TIR domain-containing protein [Corallococcus]RKH71735.1 molecular chaperone Tir [Corallococcus interemptor]RKI59634.1 molecular chaperone Tir [Corallococcus sp. AB049A]
MARRVFYSFHFDNDFWRTQQVRNINALEGQTLVAANTWEEVKKKGDASIQKWIDDQMVGKSCVVVLVGSETASRKWVQYEIKKGWSEGKGVLGIRINKLLNKDGKSSAPGANPFDLLNIKGKSFSQIASLKTPSGVDSKAAYADIAKNIEAWVEEAIKIREKY